MGAALGNPLAGRYFRLGQVGHPRTPGSKGRVQDQPPHSTLPSPAPSWFWKSWSAAMTRASPWPPFEPPGDHRRLRPLLGRKAPDFAVTPIDFTGPASGAGFLFLGLVCGLAGVGYNRLLLAIPRRCPPRLEKLPWKPGRRPWG